MQKERRIAMDLREFDLDMHRKSPDGRGYWKMMGGVGDGYYCVGSTIEE